MGYLYAVKMLIPNANPQPIKIGFTTVPAKRKWFYGSGPYPCEWLGIWPGSMQDELTLHLRFIELHKGLAGEWFLPNDEFMRVINQKIASHKKALERREARRAERDAKVDTNVESETEKELMRIKAGVVMDELAGSIH